MFETQQVTERFDKRELVVELAGRHPQLLLFQLTGKRCADLDGFNLGDEVRVEFSLRGREWTGRQGEVRYFNSLEVSKLERTGVAAEGGAPKRGGPEHEMPDDSEIPF